MHRVLRLLVLLGLTAATTPAVAQEARLTFADAVAAAGHNPRVALGRRASVTLQHARAGSPWLDANPVVTLSAGGRLAPSQERGFEGGVAVTQSISVEGGSGLRRDALGAEARWLDAEADAEVLVRRLAAASAWLALRDAEQQRAVTGRAVENEADFVRLVTRLTAAGERTTGDVAVATARLEEARLRDRMAEGAVADARGLLAAEVSVPGRGALVTDGPVPAVAVPTAAELRRLLEDVALLPSVRARALLARAEAARAQEERAQRGSRITLGLEARRDALSAGIVQASVALPLPIFAVGDREFAARHAAALRMEGEAADERVRARARVLVAAHEVEHTGEVFEALQAGLLPACERAVAVRERQFAAGEATLLDVLDARRGLFDASARVVRATRDRAWARIALVYLRRAARGAE
jgi:outer membrane protein TolC